MLCPDLLSTKDRAQATLGYPAEQLVLPGASYPTFVASGLTPFSAFVPVPPTAEITYIDAFGSVIRKILPAAEDEDIPFVPETVESVPRKTVNDIVKTMRAFRSAYLQDVQQPFGSRRVS